MGIRNCFQFPRISFPHFLVFLELPPKLIRRQRDLTMNRKCGEMASNNEESSPKRSRSEEMGSSIRYIKLDMANYDSSVNSYSDEDLVKIFELGLKVKESASLT